MESRRGRQVRGPSRWADSLRDAGPTCAESMVTSLPDPPKTTRARLLRLWAISRTLWACAQLTSRLDRTLAPEEALDRLARRPDLVSELAIKEERADRYRNEHQ